MLQVTREVARSAAAACVAIRDLGFEACWEPTPAGCALVIVEIGGYVCAQFKIWRDGRVPRLAPMSVADVLAGDEIEEIRTAVRSACPVEPQQQRVWRRIVAALDAEHGGAQRQRLQFDGWGAA